MSRTLTLPPFFFFFSSFIRDAVPSCCAGDFVKEASEVPDFLEEVEQCRKVCSADAAPPAGEFAPPSKRLQSVSVVGKGEESRVTVDVAVS